MASDPASLLRPEIRYRPGVPRPKPGKRNVRRGGRPLGRLPNLHFDLPDPFPVSAHEVAVIETFLGQRIDALLKNIPRWR